jgi:hypothetical protein
MTDDRERLASKLFMKAVFPVMKVVLEDDPVMAKRFQNTSGVVQFYAKDPVEPAAAHLVFTDGKLDIVQGEAENPDLTFWFPKITAMNAMLRGKPALPMVLGLVKPTEWLRPLGALKNAGRKAMLLGKVFSLLMSMKLMMPSARPTDPAKRHLKVKMAFYMVTTALSQYNKAGDSEMMTWTGKQPDRVYQISVEPGGIAAYLRVKAGKTRAGRGVYTRRRPFVHMQFNGVDGALAVLLKDAEFVEAVGRGFVRIEGSPEYAAQLNDFMQRIQALMV